MNIQNDNHAPSSIDEPQDRLVEVALMELVGGAMPPDFSARILAASNRARSVQCVPKQSRGEAHPVRWFVAAIAAMLLAGGTTWLYLTSGPSGPSQGRGTFESRRSSSAVSDEIGRARNASDSRGRASSAGRSGRSINQRSHGEINQRIEWVRSRLRHFRSRQSQRPRRNRR